MSKFGDDLIESLNQALAFARGAKAGAVLHIVEVPDSDGDAGQDGSPPLGLNQRQ
jgi:hypothetical protein